MREIFNPNNPVMIILTKLANLLIVNLLWAVVSLPIITLGAATTALYEVCFRIAAGDDPSVFKGFFKAFTGNFKKATMIWLLFLAALVFIGGDVYLIFRMAFYDTMLGKVTLGVFLVMVLLLFSMFNYAFAFLAYFENTIKNTLKNAALLGLAYCGRTFIMLAIDAAVIVLGFLYCPLLVPVVPIWLDAMIIRRIFIKITPSEVNTAEQSVA